MLQANVGSCTVEIGLLVDYMMLFQDCYMSHDTKFDQLDNLKLKQLSMSMGLSPVSSNALYTNDLRYPQALCAKTRSGLSPFGGIKPLEWRHESVIPGGIGHELENRLPESQRRYEAAINAHYPSGDPVANMWRVFSIEVLSKATSFVQRFIQYIDEMMRTLVNGGGNDKDEAWKIVMNAAKKIFEDHFSPVRGIPISEFPSSDSDPELRHRFFARFIWNSIQTFVLTKELLEKDIKNHHVVASAYTEWSLVNSGKPEAIKSKEMITKALAEVKDMNSAIAAMKKTVNETAILAKNAKNAADRAASSQANPGKK
jgi:hypothetical protein